MESSTLLGNEVITNGETNTVETSYEIPGYNSPYSNMQSSLQMAAREMVGGNQPYEYTPDGKDMSACDYSIPRYNHTPRVGVRESYGIDGLVDSHIITEAFTKESFDTFEKRTLYVVIIVLIAYIILFSVLRCMIKKDVYKAKRSSTSGGLW